LFGLIFDQKNRLGPTVFQGSPLHRKTLLSGIQDRGGYFLPHGFTPHDTFEELSLSLFNFDHLQRL
jgi:hypothetical protein